MAYCDNTSLQGGENTMNQEISVVMFKVRTSPCITKLNILEVLEDVSSGSITRFIDNMLIIHTGDDKFQDFNFINGWEYKNFYIASFYYGNPASISNDEITQIENHIGIRIIK